MHVHLLQLWFIVGGPVGGAACWAIKMCACMQVTLTAWQAPTMHISHLIWMVCANINQLYNT